MKTNFSFFSRFLMYPNIYIYDENNNLKLKQEKCKLFFKNKTNQK